MLSFASDFCAMAKYRQTDIPSTGLLKGDLAEVKRDAKAYYQKYLQGKEIENKATGIKIVFTSEGINKILSKTNVVNASAITFIHKLLMFAEFSNYRTRKAGDKTNVIGYINFKAKGKVGGVLYHWRISVKLKTDMKAYYYHGFNKIK